jgi:uncharacterized protein
MRVGIVALVVAAVLLAPLGLLWAFQRRLLYLPGPPTVPPAATVLPGAEEVTFPTPDGLHLGGWFLPAGPVDRQARPHPDLGYAPPPGDPPSEGRGAGRPGPAVLVCNGNGGNRSLRVSLAVALQRLGLSVLLFDYRGYGGNPGHPSEAGLAADARGALDHLVGRPEVDPGRVVYFGESLGAAVALRLATERPPAALVLRSPFASLAEVGQLHYPLVPVSLLLRDRFEAAAAAARLTAPLLVVAGGRDRIVPAAHSRRLFAAAPEPKRLVVLPGVDHNDPELNAGPRLMAELQAFLGEVPGLLA